MSQNNKKRKKGPIPNNKRGSKNDKEFDNNTPNNDFDRIEKNFDSGFDLDENSDEPPPSNEIEDNEDSTFVEEETDTDPQPIPESKEVPPPITEREIEIDYHSDRSYLYIFGPSSVGKTVIISSILNYLDNDRPEEFGDTLTSLNGKEKKHEIEGNRLWNELTTTLFENKFPKGTGVVKRDNPIPRHINAHLLLTDRKKTDFKFCCIDMSGEDLSKVNHDANENLPEIIEAYIKSLPKENICFIYILDPKPQEQLTKSEQLNIFKGFINLIDQNDHTGTPLLFLVSKWDLVSDSYENVEEYIKKEYKPIWGTLNQSAREISYAEFSIGEVRDDNKLIKEYDPKYAEKVFNWFYEKQTGCSLIEKTKNPKKDFLNNYFKK